MDSIERKIAGARAAYHALEYRGAVLDPARLDKSSGGWPAWLGWQPAVALAALLAVLMTVLLPRDPAMDPTPAGGWASPVALASPMETLSAARRLMVAAPAAPRRPPDARFQLPPSPRKSSGFAESGRPELG